MVAVAATVSAAAKAAVALLVQYSGMATIRGVTKGGQEGTSSQLLFVLVLDGVLGPRSLARHTWQCTSFKMAK